MQYCFRRCDCVLLADNWKNCSNSRFSIDISVIITVLFGIIALSSRLNLHSTALVIFHKEQYLFKIVYIVNISVAYIIFTLQIIVSGDI